LFAQAQAQRTRNRTTLPGRPPTRFYLLRGLLRCGQCGRRYHSVPNHGKRMYRCGGFDPIHEQVRCPAPRFGANRLERLVWTTVVGVLRQPDLLWEKLEAHRVQLGIRAVETRSEIQHLAKQLDEVERQEQRLLDAFLDEQLQVPALRARLEVVGQQRSALQGRHATAPEQASAL